MKFLSVLLSVIILSGSLYAIDFSSLDLSDLQLRERVANRERAAYQTWVAMFFDKAQLFSRYGFDDNELRQLNDLIDTKPPFGNRYYDEWIKNYERFVNTFSRYGFDDHEKRVLLVLLKSKPDGNISGEHYELFLAFMSKWYDSFSRYGFDDNEKANLRLFSQANASVERETGEQAYNAWLSFFNKWYETFSKYGLDENENQILDEIKAFKPSVYDENNNDSSNGFVRVRLARIQGIINLINDGKYNQALSNLYGILDN